MTDVRMYSRAAAKYRPKSVRLLWVADAPPTSLDRYFYFETMSEHDSLFREVMRAMFPGTYVPSKGGNKRPLLKAFRDAGAYLIDLHKDPLLRSWAKWWPVTKSQICRLDPDHIIPVKVTVCSFVMPRIDEMGLGDRLLTRKDVPFPGFGQQSKFHRIVDPLLRELYGRSSSR